MCSQIVDAKLVSEITRSRMTTSREPHQESQVISSLFPLIDPFPTRTSDRIEQNPMSITNIEKSQQFIGHCAWVEEYVARRGLDLMCIFLNRMIRSYSCWRH